MKKAIFMLSLIISSIAMVSCTTDAYDLPETEELKSQQFEEKLDFDLDENYSNYISRDGEGEDENGNKDNEETSNSDSSDNTGPAIIPPKKD